MAQRAGDWLRQAERDLEQARDSRAADRHEWACFAAHQAAEKSLEALHLSRSTEVWGHVVAKLLRALQPEAPAELIHKAQVLDAFYVPTRYPNGHSEGAPLDHYGPLQSGDAIEYAEDIIRYVRSAMA